MRGKQGGAESSADRYYDGTRFWAKHPLLEPAIFTVIVLPFSARLEVAQAATAPDARETSSSLHRLATNSSTTRAQALKLQRPVQLRWFLVAPPGRYCAEIDVKPTPAKAGLDLVVDGQRIPLIVPSSDAATVTIMQNIRVVPPRSGHESPVRVELTPPEPFLKGTQLPGVVLAVRLVRER
jgi:hypothetical protein